LRNNGFQCFTIKTRQGGEKRLKGEKRGSGAGGGALNQWSSKKRLHPKWWAWTQKNGPTFLNISLRPIKIGKRKNRICEI